AGIFVPEAASYVGMISFILVPLSMLYRKRVYAGFFAGLVLVAFAVAYGIEPMRWLVVHTPVLKSLKNWRSILILIFGIATLAGLGLSVIDRTAESQKKRTRLIAIALVLVGLVGGVALVYTLQHATSFRVEFARRPSFSRALLFVSAIPILLRL